MVLGKSVFLLVARGARPCSGVMVGESGIKILTVKDPDAGNDLGQEEKGVTEDEMVGWHHQLDGHKSEQAPGEALAVCTPPAPEPCAKRPGS